ncbi:uncharacterized protein LOC111086767 isoform X1 [Limulus polyphemus]|uniref:Uncharacterized protein LOC111086767 isoform X1 n=1 Tax=Limulus polyphemus TaxID=6850 RepID=A0ABM1SSR2_LIMPO|nr:uncharacterized protein LOC111086767 isoform X1 [Limulus polyphemus]
MSNGREKTPLLLKDDNIRALFSMLDLAGYGYVTKKQYENVLKLVGVREHVRTSPSVKSDSDILSLSTFVEAVKAEPPEYSHVYPLGNGRYIVIVLFNDEVKIHIRQYRDYGNGTSYPTKEDVTFTNVESQEFT